MSEDLKCRRKGLSHMWIEHGVVIALIATAQLRQRLPARAQRWVGQSTVEYALVGALVVIAAAGAMTLMGSQLTSVFSNITSTLKTASTGH